MDKQTTAPRANHTRNLLLLAGAILSVSLIGALLWPYYKPAETPPTPAVNAVPVTQDMLSQAVLEERYGLRITLIAVTAAGGMVDFRYRVIDPDKAAPLLHDPQITPLLTVMDSGITLSPAQMSRHHSQMSMKKDAVPFTFYPNVRGAVKPGTPVSVSFGKIKIQPIVAQ